VQPSAGGSAASSGGSGGPSPIGDGRFTPAHACAKCGAPLDAGQDWCLQCGTGAPDSLSSRTPTWRSAAVILTTLAILVAGAGTAAYAALSKNSPKAKPVTTAVAQVPTPTAATPVSPVTPEVGGTAAPGWHRQTAQNPADRHANPQNSCRHDARQLRRLEHDDAERDQKTQRSRRPRRRSAVR
jgi:hypothetical protein